MVERKLVAEDEWLYRRSYYNPVKNYCNPDGTATSRVFKLREKDKGELSVDVKSMTTAEISVGDKSKFFLFELHNKTVLEISDAQLSTYHDALEDGLNDAHAIITGMSMHDEITPGLLARASRKVSI